MEDIKAKKKAQFINYLTILNHQNRLLNIGPICPKPFEDIHRKHDEFYKLQWMVF